MLFFRLLRTALRNSLKLDFRFVSKAFESPSRLYSVRRVSCWRVGGGWSAFPLELSKLTNTRQKTGCQTSHESTSLAPFSQEKTPLDHARLLFSFPKPRGVAVTWSYLSVFRRVCNAEDCRPLFLPCLASLRHFGKNARESLQVNYAFFPPTNCPCPLSLSSRLRHFCTLPI